MLLDLNVCMSADPSPLQLGFCVGLTKLLQHDYCLGFPANPGARTDIICSANIFGIRIPWKGSDSALTPLLLWEFSPIKGSPRLSAPRVGALEQANKCSWMKLMRTGANGQSADG